MTRDPKEGHTYGAGAAEVERYEYVLRQKVGT